MGAARATAPYVAAVMVESITGGVFMGALGERRRQKTIARLENDFKGGAGARRPLPPRQTGHVGIAVGTPDEIRLLEDLLEPKDVLAS